MGKVVKVAAAVVGVAALFVPGVGAAIAGPLTALFSGTAIGAGGTFLGASIAGTLTAGLIASGVMSASPIADMEFRDNVLGPRGAALFRPPIETITAIRSRRHWLRFAAFEVMGDCMTPHVPHGWHGLIDREATIRAGDLIAIKTESGKVAKRFVELEKDHLVVATSNPRAEYRIPLAKVKWAYRVRAMAANRKLLIGAARTIRRDPGAHMEPLANVIIRDGREIL